MPEYDTPAPDPEWSAREQARDEARSLLESGRLRILLPEGGAHHDVTHLARVLTYCPTPSNPRTIVPTREEALAALHLLGSLREWLGAGEPRLVDAARADGATWEEIAATLPGVADRRAAKMRRTRQGPPFLDARATPG